jgi:hypothetical protein
VAATKWTEEKIEKFKKDGRGNGTGTSYTPWLNVLNGPTSNSFRVRVKGWKTHRIHHFLSRLEYYAFMHFEWDDSVLDIREQFPLNREETIILAEKLNVNHPIANGTKIVMTTDMLLTTYNGVKEELIAISIKPSNKLDQRRTLEKLEIERQYWLEKKVKWYLVTEKDLIDTLISNIEYIHDFKSPELMFGLEKVIELADELENVSLRYNETTLYEIFTNFENVNCLDEGSAISIFKYLLANKRVAINMNIKIDFNKSIRELSADLVNI